jgi:ATP-dependent Clp protease ATP-binding subunit ClpB
MAVGKDMLYLYGGMMEVKDREITLEVTQDALEKIADESYSPDFGARPVKRYLQRHIETEIAQLIIGGELSDGQKVIVDAKDGRLEFSVNK